jgi:hypothetical protein
VQGAAPSSPVTAEKSVVAAAEMALYLYCEIIFD